MEGNFVARLFDELEPCYPDSNVCTGVTRLSVAGSNGTYVGVNILMSGITPGIPVVVDVEGCHTAYKLFKMIPIPVEVNTGAKLRSEYLKNDHNDNVIRRAPFMVYEALEPIFNIVMPTTTTMGINFKTIIEYCKENSTKTWNIKITHGAKIINLVLDVEQYTFNVQKAGLGTHKFINWLYFNPICKYHHVTKWSNDFYNLLEKYLRVAAYTRQNMFAIPLDECFDIQEGSCILKEERLLKIINIAKKAGMCYFQGSALAQRELSLNDDNDFYNSLNHEKINNSDEVANLFKEKAFDYFDNGKNAVVSLTKEPVNSKEGQNTIRSITRQLNNFIIKNNLVDVYVQCALDEPNDALCESYRSITNIIREEMPKTKILEPVLPTKEIIGSLDIWCPSLDVYEENQDFFNERVKNGDSLFVYSCLTPGGNFLNRLLDMERLRIVYLAWAPAKYNNVEGFLHWGGNWFSGGNPFTRSAAMFSEQVLEFHPKRAMFLPAGDNCIFYPGYNEPLISIRSEAHRIGYEDLCMLEELKKRDEQKAKEIVSILFRGYADYEKSVSKYRETRKLLLDELSK